MKSKSRRTLIRIAAGVGFAVVLWWFISTMESIATVLMVSFILAYILNPATTYLESKGLNRSLAAFVMVLSCFCVLGGILVILIPAMVGELAKFAKEAPGYGESLSGLITRLADRLEVALPTDWGQVTDFLAEKIKESWPKIAQSAASIGKAIFASIFKSTLGIISVAVHVFLVPIIAYYLLVSFEHIREGAVDLIPPYTREPLLTKLRQIDTILAKFVRGQLMVASILAGLYALGFLLIGLDLAVVLGIVSGLLWIIPYLGTLIAVVAGTIMALAQYGDFVHVAYVWGWLAAVQIVEGYVLTPRLVGHAVGLHPVVYIVALIMGANLFGFVGMLLAIPVTAILKVLLMSAIEAYRNSYLYSDSPGQEPQP